jgi:hypothetical protein
MDSETQRLVLTALISASAAVIGGLGGAVFTARTNRVNTKDTLDHTQLLAEQRHLAALEDEHSTWLRNKKQEVYFDFFAVAENRCRNLWATRFSTELEVDYTVATARSRLKLVGTSAVRSAALEIELGLGKFEWSHKRVGAAYQDLEDSSDEDKDLAHDRLSEEVAKSEEIYLGVTERMVTFVEAARLDIGSHSEDDEIVDKLNRESESTVADVDSPADTVSSGTERELA